MSNNKKQNSNNQRSNNKNSNNQSPNHNNSDYKGNIDNRSKQKNPNQSTKK